MSDLSLLVTGASSQIGDFLLPRLIAAGHAVIAVSRRPRPPQVGVKWLVADLESPPPFVPELRIDALLHVAPIWLLPDFLHRLDAANRPVQVMAISSTSRWSKMASESVAERSLAASLAASEAALSAWGAKYGVAWTVLRPTLIYGAGRDSNVCKLARWIRKWHLFPLLGRGEGKRQPVHADDLATACVRLLGCHVAFGRTYDLSGGETLQYHEMIGRIFDALALPRRFVRLPAAPICALLDLGVLPMPHGVTPASVHRMNADLCFDHTAAARDFGYRPRPFLPSLRELGMGER